jgi:hypothetical protein
LIAGWAERAPGFTFDFERAGSRALEAVGDAA